MTKSPSTIPSWDLASRDGNPQSDRPTSDRVVSIIPGTVRSCIEPVLQQLSVPTACKYRTRLAAGKVSAAVRNLAFQDGRLLVALDGERQCWNSSLGRFKGVYKSFPG